MRRRFLAGEKLLAISRAMGLARGKVRKFAYAESFPERAVQVPGPSIIDPHLPHLEARRAQGCENAAQLRRECRERGFTGTARQVRHWLQEQRTEVHKHIPYRRLDMALPGATQSAAPALPSPKQLAWLIVKALGARNAKDAAVIVRIEQDCDAATMVRLVQKVGKLIRGAGVTSKEPVNDPVAIFDTWLAEAQTCGVQARETFATGLEQDGAAVRAALTRPWRNAQADGQITKLKLLKRSMYGCAKLDLLRKRLIFAA